MADANAEEYREEIRAWLAQHAPRGWRPVVQQLSEHGVVEYYQDWARQLHAAGHLVPHWPAEFGGRGLGFDGQVVQQQEFSLADAPRPRPMTISLGHAAATLMEHGSEDQRQLIEHILDGGIFCQGFSEPDAGSDLASVRTKAERRGGTYVISGQKTWSSFARYSTWCLLLARTDPSAPKHRGLSVFLVDMKSAGLTVRPIKQATGSSEFCEIFFDGVVIPAAMRIGEEGEGWSIAQTTLTNERAVQLIELTASMRRSIETLISDAFEVLRTADGEPLADDTAFRDRLAGVVLQLEVLEALTEDSLKRVAELGGIESVSSLLKLYLSTAVQDFTRLASEAHGIAALHDHGEPREVGYLSGDHYTDHVRSWALTISAGTNEIQRNIIAERVLGLPREPRP